MNTSWRKSTQTKTERGNKNAGLIVQPNSRIYKALRNQMTEILNELRRIENGANVDDELLAVIKTVAETYNGLQEK